MAALQNLRLSRCSRASEFAPGAEDETANGEHDAWSAHVDANERPRICLEGGEHANGRIFNEQEPEPTDERD